MIVDAHAHLGVVPQFYFPDASAQGTLALMDHLGIDRLLQSHSAWLLSMECELGYNESVAAYEESQGRILSFAVFHPGYPEESLRWVERSLDHAAFVGVGEIHPSWHGCPAEDKAYEPIWKLAAERDVPILTHSWDISDYNPTQKLSFPDRFANYAERYPGVSLILGHAGGRYRGHLAAIRLAQYCPNVYVDLSGDIFSPNLIETLVREIGASRILYGSDWAFIDPRCQLGCVLRSAISTEAREQILGGNARQLFKL
jgi:predicted TIM-barrel fold metal-dependent hydrolase